MVGQGREFRLTCSGISAIVLLVLSRGRQMFNQFQLGTRMQLSKVYFIHQRPDQEDATACAAQKILWRQRVG